MMIAVGSKKLGRLLGLLDGLLVALLYIVAINIQNALVPNNEASILQHLILLPLLSISFVWGMSYGGAYRRLRMPPAVYVWMIVSGLAFAFGTVFLVLFIFNTHFLSRFVVGVFVFGVFTVLVGVRLLLNWWYFKLGLEKEASLRRVLIIGSGQRAEKASQLLRLSSEWGVEVVGYLDSDPEMVGRDVFGVKVLGLIDGVHQVMKDHVIDEVVVAVPRSLLPSLERVFVACEEEGIRLRLMADIFDFKSARMQLDIMDNTPLISFEPVAQNEMGLLIKRIFDILMVIFSLPVVLPVMLLVALAVKLDSPGPVFFVQQRVGFRKNIFPMFKFRSMVKDGEAKLKEIEHLNEASGPNFKIANDPRITRVGRLIRSTSLDELPQLLNVLLGHMSIVGPRPMSIRDVDLFDRGVQRKRFSVRPGLTCIWQISGRSNLTFDEWLELDLKYINTWSLGLDFMILLKTVPVLLKREGAV